MFELCASDFSAQGKQACSCSQRAEARFSLHHTDCDSSMSALPKTQPRWTFPSLAFPVVQASRKTLKAAPFPQGKALPSSYLTRSHVCQSTLLSNQVYKQFPGNYSSALSPIHSWKLEAGFLCWVPVSFLIPAVTC